MSEDHLDEEDFADLIRERIEPIHRSYPSPRSNSRCEPEQYISNRFVRPTNLCKKPVVLRNKTFWATPERWKSRWSNGMPKCHIVYGTRQRQLEATACLAAWIRPQVVSGEGMTSARKSWINLENLRHRTSLKTFQSLLNRRTRRDCTCLLSCGMLC